MQSGLFYTRVSDACIEGEFRYWLRRTWNPERPEMAWILLNPSTADAYVDDPTVMKCCRLVTKWGFGGMRILNLFAFRSTSPDLLDVRVRVGDDVIGPDNDRHLEEQLSELTLGQYTWPLVMCGWGTHGSLLNRDHQVLAMLKEWEIVPHCLLKTKLGHPNHPLYLNESLLPIPL